jgi:hypothetical protein
MTTAHVDLSDFVGENIRLRFFYQWTNGSSPTDMLVIMNNIRVFHDVPGPYAASVVTPANQATLVSLTPTLAWAHAPFGPIAHGYKLFFAPTADWATHLANDVPYETIVGTTNFTITSDLIEDTNYSWMIVPFGVSPNIDAQYTPVWTFTTFTTRPQVVTLTAPANNAAFVTLTPTFTWSHATTGEPATGYFLVIKPAEDFVLINWETFDPENDADSIELGRVATHALDTPLQWDTEYTWTVIASNAYGISINNPTRSFTTMPDVPVPVTLTAPANNALFISRTPTFTWSHATQGIAATGYFLVIKSAEDFALIDWDAFDPESDTDSIELERVTTYTLTAPLLWDTEYTWTVIAENEHGLSANNPTRSFTTMPDKPLPVTSLTAPANNSIFVPLTPTFTWTHATQGVQATGYYLVVMPKADFDEVNWDVFDYETSPASTELTRVLSHTLVAPLAQGIEHSWTVVAINEHGTSSNNPSRSFTTEPEIFLSAGTGTANVQLPINANWGFTFSQTIYYPSDFGIDELDITFPITIDKIYYHWNGVNTIPMVQSSDWTIWMSLTNANVFTSASNAGFVPTSDMIQVFEGYIGDLPTAPAWIEIELDEPFIWCGVRNLVIAVNETLLGYAGGSTSTSFFGTNTTSVNRSLRSSSDTTVFNPVTMTGGGTPGFVTSYPNINIIYGTAPSDGIIDVALSNFTSPSASVAGLPVPISVAVENKSVDPITDVVVELKAKTTGGNFIAVDSQTISLNGLELTTVNFAWTPAAVSWYEIYASATITGQVDDNPDDNETGVRWISITPTAPPLPTDVEPISVVSPLGAAGIASMMPFDYSWRNSLSQSIYPVAEILTSPDLFGGAYITHITYTFQPASPNNITAGVVHHIWLGTTDNSIFANTGSWLPFSSFTHAFTGTINTTGTGTRQVIIELNTPYYYTGQGNLVVMTQREDSAWWSGHNWHVVPLGTGVTRTIRRSVDGDPQTVHQHLAVAATGIANSVPQTTFRFVPAPPLGHTNVVGIVSGPPLGAGLPRIPLVGATISTNYTPLSGLSGASGMYVVPSYNITAAAGLTVERYGFETISIPHGTLAVGQPAQGNWTYDINMEPTPDSRLNISGIVKSGWDDQIISGATVKVTLDGWPFDDFPAVITNPLGIYNIPVYAITGEEVYTIVVSADGYQPLTFTVDINDFDGSLPGPFMQEPTLLLEAFAAPVAVRATPIGGAADISWQPITHPVETLTHYDPATMSPINTNWGLSGNALFGHRFSAGMLEEMAGIYDNKLYSVSFMTPAASTVAHSIHIMTSPRHTTPHANFFSPNATLFTQTIPTNMIRQGNWTHVVLNEVVTIPPDVDLFILVRVNHTGNSTFFCDWNNAVANHSGIIGRVSDGAWFSADSNMAILANATVFPGTSTPIASFTPSSMAPTTIATTLNEQYEIYASVDHDVFALPRSIDTRTGITSTRAVTGYNVYRTTAANLYTPANWGAAINPSPVRTTTFRANDHGLLNTGTYRYLVTTVFNDNNDVDLEWQGETLRANATMSNELTVGRAAVTVNVTTSGLDTPIQGASVTLTNMTNPTLTFTQLTNASGATPSIANVPLGLYSLKVERYNHVTYSNLVEIHSTPMAIPVQLIFGEIVWAEDFADVEDIFPPVNWLSLDNDEDGNTWRPHPELGSSNSGFGRSVISESFCTSDMQCLFPDNWLITGPIVLPIIYDGGSLALTYYTHVEKSEERLAVYVIPGNVAITDLATLRANLEDYTGDYTDWVYGEPTAASGFDTLEDDIYSETVSWHRAKHDLMLHAGDPATGQTNTVRLAFRHWLSYDQLYLSLSDMAIAADRGNPPPVPFTGKVVSDAGGAIEGAAIWWNGVQLGTMDDTTFVATLTDVDGEFTVPGIVWFDSYDIKLTHDDFFDYELTFVMPEFGNMSDFVMNKIYFIAGAVTDSDANELEGIRVNLYEVDGEDHTLLSHTMTDSDGEFTFEVKAGGYALSFFHADYIWTGDDYMLVTIAHAAGDVDDIEIEMTPVFTISGIVHDNMVAENPIGNAIVILFDDDDNEIATTTTHASTGAYEFTRLFAGDYVVQASRVGYTTEAEEVEITDAHIELDIELKRFWTLSGLVLEDDATSFASSSARFSLSATQISSESRNATATATTRSGDPIVGALVTLELPGGEEITAISGADGAFSFGQLVNDTYQLSAYALGYEEASITVPIFDANNTAANITMTPVDLYEVTGVVSELGEDELEGVRVSVFVDSYEAAYTLTNADGEYMLMLPAGTWILTFAKPTFYTEEDEAVVVDTNVEDFDMSMEKILFSVEVRDHEGDLVDDVDIRITDGDLFEVLLTTISGLVDVTDIAAGTYTISTESLVVGNLPYTAQIVVLDDKTPEANDVEINLLVAPRIHGIVLEDHTTLLAIRSARAGNRSMIPVSSATLTLFALADMDTPLDTVVTDTTGVYGFYIYADGDYAIRAEKSHYVTATEIVTVVGLTDVEQDIHMQRTIEIYGVVMMPDGNDFIEVDEAIVSLVGVAPIEFAAVDTITVANDGRFEFEVDFAGQYVLTVRHATLKTHIETITLPIPYADLPLEIELAPRDVVTGRIVDNTTTPVTPITNATVRLFADEMAGVAVPVDTTGIFSIELPDIGNYYLEIIAPGFLTIAAHSVIYDGTNDVDLGDIAPAKLHTITGIVYEGAGTTTPLAGVTVRLFSGATLVATTTTATTTGAFSFADRVAGTYTVRYSLPMYKTPADTTFSIPTQGYTGLVANMSKITISGTVVSDNDVTLANLVISFIATSHVEVLPDVQLDGTTYTITNLYAGWTYSLTAMATDHNDFVRSVTIADRDSTLNITMVYTVDNVEETIIPTRTALNNNYPNPFNPSTRIAFDMANDGRVRIDIFDVRGARVTTLTNADYKAGSHYVEWSGKDEAGRNVASGIYFYRMQTEGFSETKKMMMIK